MFLTRQQAIPNTEVPPVSAGRTESEAGLSGGSIPSSRIADELPFMILEETTKSFPKFNATGRSLLIKCNSLGEEQEPTLYLLECFTGFINYLVDQVPDRDTMGLTILDTKNVKDKEVGISLRRRDQLKPDVVWDVLGKVIQSNARFVLTDRLEVRLDHVRMSAGNGRKKNKGRFSDVLSAVKKGIVVKEAFLCLARALIIAMARVNGDPKYTT
jgi:hypothetical protein